MAPSFPYMKDIATTGFVCASVLYCDAWQKHKPNIHKWLLSTLIPAGLCWFMSFLAIFWRLSPRSRVNLMEAESNYTNVCLNFTSDFDCCFICVLLLLIFTYIFVGSTS